MFLIKMNALLAAALVCVGFASAAFGDEAQTKQSSNATKENNREKIVGTTVVTTFSAGVRASELIGMEVRNAKGKELGEITDLVMDRYGQIRYAAMSRGGLLGVGDKLFAVPFCCATIMADKDDSDEHYVMFDVKEEKLEESPGFDQENWPAVGSSSYWLTIDKHYEDDVKRAEDRQQKEKNSAASRNNKVSNR